MKDGEYWAGWFQELRGEPAIVDSVDYSKDTEIGKKLWKASEKMTAVSDL